MDIKYTDPSDSGETIYAQVRSGFIAQGSSLNKWCLDHGVKRENARACLLGLWSGPKATALRLRLIQAAGLAPKKTDGELLSRKVVR
jgi:hypothetical protein